MEIKSLFHCVFIQCDALCKNSWRDDREIEKLSKTTDSTVFAVGAMTHISDDIDRLLARLAKKAVLGDTDQHTLVVVLTLEAWERRLTKIIDLPKCSDITQALINYSLTLSSDIDRHDSMARMLGDSTHQCIGTSDRDIMLWRTRAKYYTNIHTKKKTINKQPP